MRRAVTKRRFEDVLVNPLCGTMRRCEVSNVLSCGHLFSVRGQAKGKSFRLCPLCPSPRAEYQRARAVTHPRWPRSVSTLSRSRVTPERRS
ncbi:MAG: hypothetical protein WC986_14520 [Elusimicrobiota bacterium]|jgi:hypothetical protein